MSDILVTSPFHPFTLPNQFKAVFNGYIYCGTVDAVDPSVSQVQVYLVNESGEKVPVAQPLRTNAGGFLVYNGQPAKFITDSNHSLLVQDSFHSQVWYASDMSNIDPESLIFILSEPDGAGYIGSANYAQIRAYAGSSTKIECYGRTNAFDGANGTFYIDASDTVSADNDGTILVDSLGRRWKRQYTGQAEVSFYGADGAAIQSAISATSVDPASVDRGSIEFKSGSEINVPVQLEILQKNIKFSGNNAALSWTGPNDKAMFHIVDSSRMKFEDMVILGNLTNPPTAALFFDRTFTTSEKGTNEACVVDGLILGRRYMHDTPSGGSSDPASYALLQNGIVVGGIDGNNDEYVISNTKVHSCHDGANTGKGIAFLNTQSTWSSIRDTLVNDSDIGFYLGCNLHMYTVASNRCSVVDIIGARDLETWIFGANAENSTIFIKSQGGASFFVYGGELQRNSVTPQTMFRWENGGSMVLEGLRVWNVVTSTKDTVYYRPGSAKGGRIGVKNCTIDHGNERDTWDIDTSHSTGPSVEIDIDHGPFKWKMTKPYADRAVTPPTIAAGASGLVGSGLAKTPLGDFHHAAYQFDLQSQHLTVCPEVSTQIRARIFNVTTNPITLAPGRVRWMNLGDHIVATGSAAIDPPLLANNTGHTATIALPGAQLGDFIAFGAMAAYLNAVVTAYVSAPNVVSVRIHNATGGNSDLASTILTVGKMKEFGRFNAAVMHTPTPLANAATTAFYVAVPGAQLGGHAFVAYSADLQGLVCTASINADGSVEVVLTNYTGAAVTLAAGYFKVMVAF